MLLDLRGGDASLRPADLLFAIGTWKNRSIGPQQAESLADTDRQHLAAMGYRRYQQALRNSGVVDFDDLLMLTEQLFEEHPDALAEEAGRFDHVLIDEYQDTNGSQYRIVRSLALSHRNLCVVGDDDQSIYAWRGAEVKHILNFQKDWPDAKGGSTCRKLSLHRSHPGGRQSIDRLQHRAACQATRGVAGGGGQAADPPVS